MKTNNVMVRPMGQFKVEQRTKDGMFNATSLMNQWNDNSGQKKNINHYLDNSTTKEFMEALVNDDANIRNSERPMNQVFTKTKAKTNSDGSRIAGEVWMCPLMFIDFAMWINPSFKVKVLKFVYDQMIKYRNDAGDAYRELGGAISNVVGKEFMPVAMTHISKAINYIVFGEHYPLVRNDKGTEELQRELFEMERKIADLVNDGFLQSYDEIINYLRKKWREKHTPSVLQ